MADNDLSRMAYRKDQLLQLPFPRPPSLAGMISNGVLKKDGASAYDLQNQKFQEAIQNILKLALQFPKFTDLERQFELLAQTVAGLATEVESTAEIQAQILALQTSVNEQAASISSLNSSVENILAAINQNSVPLLLLTNSGENPNFPLQQGVSGIFGPQRALNVVDGAFWTWAGSPYNWVAG